MVFFDRFSAFLLLKKVIISIKKILPALYKVKVIVKRRPSILDPQGKAAEQGAALLGFNNIQNVRINKEIEFTINTDDFNAAQNEAEEFCKKLLANPIMEDYEISLEKKNES